MAEALDKLSSQEREGLLVRNWTSHDALGLRYTHDPPIGRCLMALGQECRRTIRLELKP